MSQVVYEKRDRFAYLRLNRPEAKNAIDKEKHLALCEIWADFRGRRRARPRHRDRDRDRCVFCAGMDLKTFVPEYPGAMPQMIRVRAELGLGGLPRGFHGIPKPMIAALNGWALAADFELTLAADIRIASERAGSGSVEARRGFHHGDGMILRLINACGTGVAAELVISAEPIDARRAGYSKSMVRVIRYETSWRDHGAAPLKPTGGVNPLSLR